jgi:hypothetical protein
MSYSQPWSSRRPGCLILLLDQSGSMSDPFGNQQAGGGKRKCDMLATVVNGFLNELVTANTVINKDGIAEVRPRADIAVLGYEGTTITSALKGPLGRKEFVTLQELQDNPIAIEQRKRREIDETGMAYEIEVSFPVWVKPVAGAGTPMCGALRRAADLAQRWASQHPEHYPPVIINVTDGMATDGDPAPVAMDLTRIATQDGAALLFNVHITSINSAPVEYPSHESELPNDRYAYQLFSMTSLIPETSLTQLSAMLRREIMPGARGLIFNGDAVSIRQMFVFASLPATQSLDPLR